MFFVDLLKNHLNTKLLGKKIFYYQITESTNDDIWQLLSEGEEEGIVVVADEQNSGRGRNNSTWHSQKGESLIFSILIKQKFSVEKIGLNAILIPIGIISAIKKIINKNLSIKWPNDITYENKKVGGILIESKKYNGATYLNIGIGINVNDDTSTFPLDIKIKSTSLKNITKEIIQREVLLAKILNDIDALLFNKEETKIVLKWMEFCSHINEKVPIQYNHKTINGVFKKINQKGQAIINYNNKEIIFDGPFINL